MHIHLLRTVHGALDGHEYCNNEKNVYLALVHFVSCCVHCFKVCKSFSS